MESFLHIPPGCVLLIRDTSPCKGDFLYWKEPGLPEKAELENQAWITRPETAIRVRGAEHN